jgi:hypothetical protein
MSWAATGGVSWNEHYPSRRAATLEVARELQLAVPRQGNLKGCGPTAGRI